MLVDILVIPARFTCLLHLIAQLKAMTSKKKLTIKPSCMTFSDVRSILGSMTSESADWSSMDVVKKVGKIKLIHQQIWRFCDFAHNLAIDFMLMDIRDESEA